MLKGFSELPCNILECTLFISCWREAFHGLSRISVNPYFTVFSQLCTPRAFPYCTRWEPKTSWHLWSGRSGEEKTCVLWLSISVSLVKHWEVAMKYGVWQSTVVTVFFVVVYLLICLLSTAQCFLPMQRNSLKSLLQTNKFKH